MRNRVKRLLREAVRTTPKEVGPLVSGFDVILIARPPIVGHTYAEVREVVRTLLRRAKLLLPPALPAEQEAQSA